MTQTTTIEELARTIAETHGIDSHAAAIDVVRVHVDQITDDPDLYDPEAEELTGDGAAVVAQAVADSYAHDMYGTTAARLLNDLTTAARKLALAEQAVRDHTAARDEMIRAALKTELRRADIAAAAGVKEARLYQIRDGRR